MKNDFDARGVSREPPGDGCGRGGLVLLHHPQTQTTHHFRSQCHERVPPGYAFAVEQFSLSNILDFKQYQNFAEFWSQVLTRSAKVLASVQ